MRGLYSLLWGLLLPLAFLHLIWRAARQPEYLRHWRERIGLLTPRRDNRPVIWLHAVSVGETRASAPLVHALRDRHPAARLLITHGTPTGRAAGRELFGPDIDQAYLPYDLPWCVAGFLRRARPCLGIILETEIWPNLYQACQARAIPLFLVNGRLSERSARGYARIGRLTRQALSCLSGIAAQSEADATRLQRLGAAGVVVVGNLKYDAGSQATADIKPDLRALVGDRFVWLAASTREGEESLILEIWSRLDIPNLLLVIVPRHPQRFASVAKLMRSYDPTLALRSDNRPVSATTRLMLGDSMGEMASYYALSDIAFIGGSLAPFGGQNLIEAAAAGKPVLVGPHTWNFSEAADQALASGAAWRVTVDDLGDAVRRLSADPETRQAMGVAGRNFSAARRGATQRTLDMIEPALSRALSRLP